jgi:hypothetical protein
VNSRIAATVATLPSTHLRMAGWAEICSRKESFEILVAPRRYYNP